MTDVFVLLRWFHDMFVEYIFQILHFLNHIAEVFNNGSFVKIIESHSEKSFKYVR